MTEERSDESEMRQWLASLSYQSSCRPSQPQSLSCICAPLLAEVTRLRTETAGLIDTLNRVTGERDGFRIDGNASRAERDAARVEVSQLHAKIERVEQLAAEAEARGAKSLPPGMVVSGCSPLASVVTPEQIRAALAAPLGETPGGD